jgi:hypothetical protein
MYYDFLIFLSLFSSTIFPLLMYSFTCIPNSISALLLLCILCFSLYHGIKASTVSLFTQSGEQPDPKKHNAYIVNESTGREILHKAWREIRSPPFAQKIVAESKHEEAERNTVVKVREHCRENSQITNSRLDLNRWIEKDRAPSI